MVLSPPAEDVDDDNDYDDNDDNDDDHNDDDDDKQERKRCHKLWCCHLPPVRPLYELAARRALTTTTRGQRAALCTL